MCEFDRTKPKKVAKETIESPTPTRRQPQVRRNRASKASRDTTNTEVRTTRRVSPRTATKQVVFSEASDVSSQGEKQGQDQDENGVTDEVTEAAEVLISLRNSKARVFSRS